jgi:DTW domain-containing protein YfiP
MIVLAILYKRVQVTMVNATSNHHIFYTSPTSYIILDGTWQEAKSMLRKIPALCKLPRLSLSSLSSDILMPLIPSIYTLRKDYTGWRERFRGYSDENDNGNNNELLCTAEVAAAIMDWTTGNRLTGDVIRTRLEMFQENIIKCTKTPHQSPLGIRFVDLNHLHTNNHLT